MTLQIKVDLDSQFETQFQQLKDMWNFTSNTQTIRHMITQTWQQEINEDQQYIEINEGQLDHIKVALQHKDIQRKYYMYNVTDFVREAIRSFLEDIEANRRSLYDYDVRSTMTEEELTVAKAITQLQDTISTDDFTLEQLQQALAWRNAARLERILDEFEQDGLVSVMQIGGTNHYHAHKP